MEISNGLYNQLAMRKGLHGKALEDYVKKLANMDEEELQKELQNYFLSNSEEENDGFKIEHSVIAKKQTPIVWDAKTYKDSYGNEVTEYFDKNNELISKVIVYKDSKGNTKESIIEYEDGKIQTKRVKLNGNTTNTITYTYETLEGDNELITVKNKKSDKTEEITSTMYVYEDGEISPFATLSRETTLPDGSKKGVYLTEKGVIEIVENSTQTVTTLYNCGNMIMYDYIEPSKLAECIETSDGKQYSAEYDGNGNTVTYVQSGESIGQIAAKFNKETNYTGAREGDITEGTITALEANQNREGDERLSQIGATVIIPGEYPADSEALKGRLSKESAIAQYHLDRAKDKYNKLVKDSRLVKKITIKNAYDDVISLAKSLLPKGADEGKVWEKVYELMALNSWNSTNVEIKKGTKITVIDYKTEKAIRDQKTQLNNLRKRYAKYGFTDDDFGASFISQYDKSNSSDKKIVEDALSRFKRLNGGKVSWYPFCKDLYEIYHINMFPTKKTIPLDPFSNLKTHKSVPLEIFLKDNFNLDITKGNGKEAYLRLASLSQEQLNNINLNWSYNQSGKIPLLDFIQKRNPNLVQDLSKAKLEDISSAVFGMTKIDIRTEEEINKAQKFNPRKNSWENKRKTANMFISVATQAYETFMYYYNSIGYLSGDAMWQGLKSIANVLSLGNVETLWKEKHNLENYLQKAFQLYNAATEEEFNRIYRELTNGCKYDENNIAKFIELQEKINNGKLNANSEEYKNAVKCVFGSDMTIMDKTQKSVQGQSTKGIICNIVMMLCALGEVSKLSQMKNFGQWSVKTFGRVLGRGVTGAVSLAGWSAVQGGVNLATMTRAVTIEDIKNYGKGIAASSGFGLVGGIWGETVVSPVMKWADASVNKLIGKMPAGTAEALEKVTEKITKLFTNGSSKTAAEVLEAAAQTPGLTAQFIGALTDILGFTLYESTLDLSWSFWEQRGISSVAVKNIIKEKVSMRGELTTEKAAEIDNMSAFEAISTLLIEEGKQQLESLGTIKGIDALIKFIYSGRLGMAADMSMQFKDNKYLQSMKTRRITVKGKQIYEVTMPDGKKAIFANELELLNFCNQKMQENFLIEAFAEKLKKEGKGLRINLPDGRKIECKNTTEMIASMHFLVRGETAFSAKFDVKKSQKSKTVVNEGSDYLDLLAKSSRKIKTLIENNPELKNNKWLQENIEDLLYTCKHPYRDYSGYTLSEKVEGAYDAVSSAIKHPLLIKHRLEVLETILQAPTIIKILDGYELHNLLGMINDSQTANNIINSVKYFNHKYQDNQNCLKHIKDVVFNTGTDINDKKILLDLISKHNFIANYNYLGDIRSHEQIVLMNKLINNNEFPNNLVVDIIKHVHKSNAELANKLCSEKDFPNEYIADVLSTVYDNNIKIANAILFDKNFSIEDIINILHDQQTGIHSPEYVYQLVTNYNQIGIYPSQIIALINNQGIINVESVVKLNKLLPKDKAVALTTEELKVLANTINLFGRKNIEELSKTEKRNLLENILLSKSAIEQGALSKIKEFVVFYPNNTAEYSKTITKLTQSLNIINNTKAVDIKDFNQQLDDLVSTIKSISQERLNSISLEVSHDIFIKKINSILKDFSKEKQVEIQSLFGFKIVDNKLTGYPNSNIELSAFDSSYKEIINKVKSAISEYTDGNRIVIAGEPELSNILSNIIQSCPEILSQIDSSNTLSKALVQLQKIVQFDTFNNLSVQDKQIMVLATLFNNLDPTINSRTDTAFDAYNICKKLNLDDNSARKLLTIIEFSDAPDRFMNKTKEKTSVQRRLVWEGQQRHDTFDYMALKLRAGNLFKMTQMLYSTNYVDGFTRNFDKKLQTRIDEFKSKDFSLLQTPKETYDNAAQEEVYTRGSNEYKVKVVHLSSIPDFYALTHCIEGGMVSGGSIEANYNNFEILCAPYNDKVICACFVSSDKLGPIETFGNVLIIEADNYDQFVANPHDLGSDSRTQQDLILEYFRPHAAKGLKFKNEERAYVSKYLKQLLYGKYYSKIFDVDKAYNQRFDNIIKQLNGEPISIEKLEIIDPEFADAFKSFLSSDKTLLSEHGWNEVLVTPKRIIAIATNDMNKLPEFYLKKAEDYDIPIIVIDQKQTTNNATKSGLKTAKGANDGVKGEVNAGVKPVESGQANVGGIILPVSKEQEQASRVDFSLSDKTIERKYKAQNDDSEIDSEAELYAKAMEFDKEIAKVSDQRIKKILCDRLERLEMIHAPEVIVVNEKNILLGRVQTCKNLLDLVERIKDNNIKQEITEKIEAKVTELFNEIDQSLSSSYSNVLVKNLYNIIKNAITNDADKFRLFLITEKPEIYEEIIKDDLDINNLDFYELKKDFEIFERFGDDIKYCKNNPNSPKSEEIYEEYLQNAFVSDNTKISEAIKDRCRQINREFGVKVFLPSNLKEAGVALKLVYQELFNFKIFAQNYGQEAKMPPTLDFLHTQKDYIHKNSVGFYLHKDGTISIKGLTIEQIKHALRHELMHANDKIETMDFPDGFDPAVYIDDLLEAGVTPSSIVHGLENRREFIATATEGDMRLYWDQFKKVLLELGMPEWVLDMQNFSAHENIINNGIKRLRVSVAILNEYDKIKNNNKPADAKQNGADHSIKSDKEKIDYSTGKSDYVETNFETMNPEAAEKIIYNSIIHNSEENVEKFHGQIYPKSLLSYCEIEGKVCKELVNLVSELLLKYKLGAEYKVMTIMDLFKTQSGIDRLAINKFKELSTGDAEKDVDIAHKLKACRDSQGRFREDYYSKFKQIESSDDQFDYLTIDCCKVQGDLDEGIWAKALELQSHGFSTSDIRHLISCCRSTRSNFEIDNFSDELYQKVLDLKQNYNIPNGEIYQIIDNCKTKDGTLSEEMYNFAIELSSHIDTGIGVCARWLKMCENKEELFNRLDEMKNKYGIKEDYDGLISLSCDIIQDGKVIPDRPFGKKQEYTLRINEDKFEHVMNLASKLKMNSFQLRSLVKYCYPNGKFDEVVYNTILKLNNVGLNGSDLYLVGDCIYDRDGNSLSTVNYKLLENLEQWFVSYVKFKSAQEPNKDINNIKSNAEYFLRRMISKINNNECEATEYIQKFIDAGLIDNISEILEVAAIRTKDGNYTENRRYDKGVMDKMLLLQEQFQLNSADVEKLIGLMESHYEIKHLSPEDKIKYLNNMEKLLEVGSSPSDMLEQIKKAHLGFELNMIDYPEVIDMYVKYIKQGFSLRTISIVEGFECPKEYQKNPEKFIEKVLSVIKLLPENEQLSSAKCLCHLEEWSDIISETLEQNTGKEFVNEYLHTLQYQIATYDLKKPEFRKNVIKILECIKKHPDKWREVQDILSKTEADYEIQEVCLKYPDKYNEILGLKYTQYDNGVKRTDQRPLGEKSIITQLDSAGVPIDDALKIVEALSSRHVEMYKKLSQNYLDKIVELSNEKKLDETTLNIIKIIYPYDTKNVEILDYLLDLIDSGKIVPDEPHISQIGDAIASPHNYIYDNYKEIIDFIINTKEACAELKQKLSIDDQDIITNLIEACKYRIRTYKEDANAYVTEFFCDAELMHKIIKYANQGIPANTFKDYCYTYMGYDHDKLKSLVEFLDKVDLEKYKDEVILILSKSTSHQAFSSPELTKEKWEYILDLQKLLIDSKTKEQFNATVLTPHFFNSVAENNIPEKAINRLRFYIESELSINANENGNATIDTGFISDILTLYSLRPDKIEFFENLLFNDENYAINLINRLSGNKEVLDKQLELYDKLEQLYGNKESIYCLFSSSDKLEDLNAKLEIFDVIDPKSQSGQNILSQHKNAFQKIVSKYKKTNDFNIVCQYLSDVDSHNKDILLLALKNEKYSGWIWTCINCVGENNVQLAEYLIKNDLLKNPQAHFAGIINKVHTPLESDFVIENFDKIPENQISPIIYALNEVNADLIHQLITDKELNFPIEEISNIAQLCSKNNIDLIRRLCTDRTLEFPVKQISTIAALTDYSTDNDFAEKLCTDKSLNCPPDKVGDILKAIKLINVDTKSLLLSQKLKTFETISNLDKSILDLCRKYSPVDIDAKIAELTVSIGKKKDLIEISEEQQRMFVHTILANNNQDAESILKNFNFEQYGKNGLPLKYTREEFTSNIENLIEDLTPEEQRVILEHFGLIKGFAGFDGLANNKPLFNKKYSAQFNDIAQKVKKEIDKFTTQNEVMTGDIIVDKVLGGLIKGLPEFTLIVGKEQHGTHAYSVDIHTLKVLQSAMNHPLYEQLSDYDKTILKIAALCHDFGKRGGVVDDGHASTSADYAVAILSKFSFPQNMKDRIIDIIENHHWFEAYNKFYAKAEDVAVRCRRPQDFIIYEILAKADFENVNNNFHISNSEGVSNQSEFDAFMQTKMQPIDEVLRAIYSQANLVFDTQFMHNGENFPRQIINLDGERTEFKVLNFNKLSNHDSLTEYGFSSGVTKENARFTVHMTNPEFGTLESVMILTQNSLNQSTWSTSLVKASNNRTYCNRKFGFILDVDLANISEAYYANVGSGTSKGLNDFKSIIFNAYGYHRTFVKDRLIAELNKNGIHLDDSEYGELVKQLLSKKYTTQITKDITIGGKMIKASILVECLEKSRDSLFEGGDMHSEIVSINPRVKGLFAKVDKLEDCPEEFLRLAKKYDLPIILMKPTKEK